MPDQTAALLATMLLTVALTSAGFNLIFYGAFLLRSTTWGTVIMWFSSVATLVFCVLSLDYVELLARGDSRPPNIGEFAAISAAIGLASLIQSAGMIVHYKQFLREGK